MGKQHKDLQEQLNRSMPIAKDMGLGDTLQELITAYNDLAAKHNDFVTTMDGLTNGSFNMVPTMMADSINLKDINDRQ